jgi:hypothetical protein
MYMHICKRIIITTAALATVVTPSLALATTYAAASDESGPATTDKGSDRLAAIKTKGDAEITRRLATLNALTSKISNSAKATATDKTTLSGEVTTEISGLTALKAKLDAETTVAGAAADVASMVTEYRVYALLVPKMSLIKTADDQQAVEAKLAALATKLQTRITAAKSSGKDVAIMQASLDDLNAKVAAAQAISGSVEKTVLPLQPTDYNSDHSLLSGYRDQLKTAHTDNQTAFADAKSIVAALKNK